MSVSSCFAAFWPVLSAAPARPVRGRVVEAGLAALALAAAVASPSWAEASQKPAHSGKKTVTALDLNPDGSVPDKVVKAGAQTSVATVWDCELPTMSPVVSARVEHGSVAIATGDGPRCGRPSMRVTEIFYTPAPGYKGVDKLYILAFVTRGDINQTYSILVK